MAHIVVTQVGREPCRHELTERIVIGRSSDCDVSVADHLLSRRHCAIEPVDDTGRQWAVEDLDSLNGTRVGAMYVNHRVLVDGDEITIGEVHVSFHGSPYEGRRPDRPEIPEHDEEDVDEALLRAGPWPQPRTPEPRLPSLPEWDTPLVAEQVTDSQSSTADEGVPEHARHYGVIAGIAASAATIGAAAVWMLTH
jgi:pSer/pThr/pTyr-binding forkhead associated (FHA) protein